MSSIWQHYPATRRELYVQYLQAYGALTGLFLQKNDKKIPYLDSKFQETIYGKVFDSQNTDIGNTPHDIVSIIDGARVGIGLKTWISSRPSYQKVMQLKAFKNEIDSTNDNPFDKAFVISRIKNDRMKRDYKRLGLNDAGNIYHYVTRDESLFSILETSYPTVNLNNITVEYSDSKSLVWNDGDKLYKYTHSDSQVWMHFSSDRSDTTLVQKFPIVILEDPFSFLLEVVNKKYLLQDDSDNDVNVAYLPLYSYRTGEVETKSGLNAWNGASKNKNSNTPRPLGEVYIPVPIEFHKKNPSFFTDNIFDNIRNKKPIEFTIILPNGIEMPGRLTGDNLKNFQSGSSNIRKSDGSQWGQADLGNWLLVDVLGLNKRELVTRKWLDQRGVDSVKLWHNGNDKNRIYLDVAKTGSFDDYITKQ